MPRTRSRPRPTHAQTLKPVLTHCPECGGRLGFDYANYRTVTTLDAVTRQTLQVRRCSEPGCPRYHRPYRPEAEPHVALPHHELGLDGPMVRPCAAGTRELAVLLSGDRESDFAEDEDEESAPTCHIVVVQTSDVPRCIPVQSGVE